MYKNITIGILLLLLILFYVGGDMHRTDVSQYAEKLSERELEYYTGFAERNNTIALHKLRQHDIASKKHEKIGDISKTISQCIQLKDCNNTTIPPLF